MSFHLAAATVLTQVLIRANVEVFSVINRVLLAALAASHALSLRGSIRPRR